jgi:hypothetical protein
MQRCTNQHSVISAKHNRTQNGRKLCKGGRQGELLLVVAPWGLVKTAQAMAWHVLPFAAQNPAALQVTCSAVLPPLGE